MERTFDKEKLEKIVNHPSVLPWVSEYGQGKVDFGNVVEDKNNHVLIDETGGFIFKYLEPTVYEVHAQFLEEGRGKHAFDIAKEVMYYMFVKTDCMTVYCNTPEHCQEALIMSKLMGCQSSFRTPMVWQTEQGPVDMLCSVMTYEDWVKRDKKIVEVGEKFIEKVKWEKDESFKRYLGMLVSMLKFNMLDKGIVLYNRWARLSKFPLVNVECANPMIIELNGLRFMKKEELVMFEERTV